MNQVALVTGAGGGIGAAVCYHLAPHYRLAAAGRERARLEGVVATVHNEGGGAVAVTFDLTDADATHTALAQVREEFGPISPSHPELRKIRRPRCPRIAQTGNSLRRWKE